MISLGKDKAIETGQTLQTFWGGYCLVVRHGEHFGDVQMSAKNL